MVKYWRFKKCCWEESQRYRGEKTAFWERKRPFDRAEWTDRTLPESSAFKNAIDFDPGRLSKTLTNLTTSQAVFRITSLGSCRPLA